MSRMNDEPYYHFIGIGGIGMSALARILLEKKLKVTGSDASSSALTDSLSCLGAHVKLGHQAEAISSQATVVYSSGIRKNNPEYQQAVQLECPLLHRSELLAQLMEGYQTLAVTGTHGKTTVSSLLTTVLLACDQDPTFAIGGLINGLNGKLGQGEYFVAEADESDASFLNYQPHGAIITNLEPEHMENYGSLENLKSAFLKFVNKVSHPQWLFYCGDDPGLRSLNLTQGFSYGFKEENSLKITSFHQKGWGFMMDIHFLGKEYHSIEVPLVGMHNALNAAAVFGLALCLGLSEEGIRKGLKHFSGVARRCEKKADIREILLIDDYAHHPTEIKKTLEGVRDAIGERRLIAVFQPHRYTRVKDFLEEFAKAFDFADEVFITEIYAASEEPMEGVTSETLIEKMRQKSTVKVHYLPLSSCVSTLHSMLRPHDVVITMGAGSITSIHKNLIEKLQQDPSKKLTVGLIFGGRSCEHEISLRSARFVNASLNRDLYEVKYFGMDKNGDWIYGDEASNSLQHQSVIASSHAKPLYSEEIMKALAECDLFFPVLHGPYGEDGTLQGFFEMLGKPYAGPHYRAAAICMDKVLTKKLVASEGVPTPAFKHFHVWQWLKEQDKLLEEIVEELHFPLFVKPSHVGSSVGISKVNDKQALKEAIDYAFRYDMSLLVEEGKEQCRELEFAVIGNLKGRISVPKPGEKLAQGEFVDYEKKYGTSVVSTTIDPTLSEDLLEKGKAFALHAYEATGNSGMTRVDFLLDSQGQFWFFEMNPIPGLQQFSLFPKIWNREGVAGPSLMDKLIILGLQRHREQNRHLNTL